MVMTTELQRTFGAAVGLDPVVPTADLPTDLVDCVDTGETIARADAMFHKNGDAYEDDAELGECPNCWELVECDELDDNGGWCEECDDDERIVCSDCDEHVLRDDSHGTRSGNTICEDCRDNHYSYCEDCEENVPSDDITVIGECHCVCDNCLRRNYTECNSCNTYVEDSDIVEATDGNTLCPECRNADYSVCNGCSEYAPDHEIDGDGNCAGCHEEDEEDEYVAPARPARPADGKDYSLGSDLNSDRTYGVEIELSTVRDRDNTDYKVGAAGWRCTCDGSVNGDDREYVSPVLEGNEGLRKIRKVTGYLKGCGADSSAGLHLHMGMGDLDENARKAVALAYHYTCDVWHAFVSSSRDNYRYCRRHAYSRKHIIDTTNLAGISTRFHTYSRYIWMNWRALAVHGTLEVRLHHGTCDGYEIQSWVKAHVRFVDAVSKLSVAQVTRVFGGKDRFVLFAEMSRIWDDAELTGYYATKARCSDRPVRKVDAA